MKNEKDNQFNTEFHKEVVEKLRNVGFSNVENEKVAFLVENNSDDVVVDYNFMSTGIHYNKKNINERDVLDAGFKYWGTWNFCTNS